MEQHYLAILVPESTGGWSLLFPDLPGCATHGATVPEAIAAASKVACAWLAATCERGDEIPTPKSYKDVGTFEAWARDRGIDWSTAVISSVPVTFPANDS